MNESGASPTELGPSPPPRLRHVAIGVTILLTWLLVPRLFAEDLWGRLDLWGSTLLFWLGPITFMLVYPLAVERDKVHLSPRKPDTPDLIIEGLYTILFVAALMAVNYFVFMLLTDGTRTWNERMTDSGVSPDAMFVLLISAFVGPAAEEVFYRWFVYRSLRKRIGIAIALIIEAALFAATHEHMLAVQIPIFITGIALALIYEWRRTIVAPIAVHTLHNVIYAIIAWTAMTSAVPPMIGVQVEPVEDGLRIVEVVEGLPGDHAGLRANDVILAVDGKPTLTHESLLHAIWSREKHTLTLTVDRDGQRVEIPIDFDDNPRP